MDQASLPAIEEHVRSSPYRYFGPQGCVQVVGETRQVLVGGNLVGQYDVSDRATRNAIVVHLSQDKSVHLGHLATAFELGEEQLRRLRRRHEVGGLSAVLEIRHGGRRAKLTPRLRQTLCRLFDAGLSIDESHEKIRGRVCRAVVGRARKAWAVQARADLDASASAEMRVPASTPTDAHAPAQLDLVSAQPSEIALDPTRMAPGTGTGTEAEAPCFPSTTEEPELQPEIEAEARQTATDGDQVAPLGSTSTSTGPADAPSLHGGPEVPSEVILDGHRQYVQHAGSWILLAMMHAFGVYQHAESLRLAAVKEGDVEARHLGATALRVAIDAAIMALGIGQGCVEGVRRIATPSARTLLRIAHSVPSPSWVREVLGRFASARGQAMHVATMFALIDRAQREKEPRAWFYVDNHMRPYTGKHVVRKGWRMQDKSVRPGSSDYWVHDDDGRPLVRVGSPSHEPMTERLRPIARMLRAGLDQAGAQSTKVALVFDRAGAFPSEMAAVRDEGFEFVTYERGPYPRLLSTEFKSEIIIGKELFRYVELHQKNLRSGRGRVRRIHLLSPEGEQINVVACSAAPAEELIQNLLARWARQENQFKYGVERLGFNQLDGRRVKQVDPDELIPNPARRRLLRALGVARQLEGEALRKLAHLPAEDAKRIHWEQELARSRALQTALEAQRPELPKKVRVADSELAGKLVRHKDEYKLVLDTLRLLIANVESELAALLGPHLARPAEAKKTLTNLFAAPAVVHATRRAIVVDIAPAGTKREIRAFGTLLASLNDQRLTLPGDPDSRPLRFRTHLERDDQL